jgi:hypothetical protein
MSPVALWSASARGHAAKADGMIAEAHAGDSPPSTNLDFVLSKKS